MIKFERLGVIIAPEKDYQAKFNPGMIRVNDEVHMLYRFCEKKSKWHGKSIDWSELQRGSSFIESPYEKNCINYARLNIDGTLLYDANESVLFPELPYEASGCEDARIVEFEGSYYIFYTGWDLNKVRVCIAKTEDFKTYEKIGVIDNFEGDKDAFIFPERVNGKIAYMHRISPNIQIDYFDSMEELLSEKSFEGYENRVEAQTVIKGEFDYEAKKVGGGLPPIKTEKGWLVIYHGVDSTPNYHAAAALLDLNNPSIVIARLPYPILSPEADFETTGDYNGCVFPVGGFVDNGELYISYGTADKYVAIAKMNLNELVEELDRHRL
jgi:beta-1,2-mannobiose phosphorylase / 1,2-beta-oligomannan phosphorylase